VPADPDITPSRTHCVPHPNLLEVEDLRVDFHTDEGITHAVRGVSFAIRRGTCLAIVGESGSGKSVSAYAINRLIQKPGVISGGRITLYPRAAQPLPVLELEYNDPRLYHLRGGLVSMVFQEPMSSLSPVHSIGNQICEAILTHQPVTAGEARQRAAEMLARVGIPDPETRLRQYPHELSGGMRQRVVIAMALVCNPELLICDEPTTALDVTIQAQILKLIKELQASLQTSVLFITHDMGVVAQVADAVAVMYAGRILEYGSVRQVLKDPRHVYTRGLLAAIPGRSGRKSRLATIDAIVGSEDITSPFPLRQLNDGRLMAMSDSAFRELL
jgi:ABC-type dipeptide/oligopeptide/nickel transport system ATPase component